MEEKKTPPTFSWIGRGDVTPLPTDYSPTYLEGKWKINNDTIAAYTTKHPDFDYFYQWMRYLFPDNTKSESFVHRGIPAELEPFFHEYINQAISQNINPNSLHLDSKSLKDFDKNLALHLHRMATDAEQNHEESESSVDSGLYWYRRLYNNPYFKKSVSTDYWDQEYDWRCQAIKELSQSLPQEEQIGLLKDMISTLDIKISYIFLRRKQIKEDYARRKASSSKKITPKTKKTFLHSFPIQLIDALRRATHKSNQSSPNSRKYYSIPNAQIEIENSKIKTLEHAFSLMPNKLDEASREHVRSVYLDQVCTTPPKSIFQQACVDLQEYLDMYTTTPDEVQKYKQYIQTYCLRYYCGVWSYSPPLKDGYTTVPRNKPALERFLDNIIGSYCRTYSDRANIVARTIIPVYLNNPIEQCKERYQSYVSKNFADGHLRSDIPLRAGAYRINKDIQDLWIDGYLPPRTMQNNVFSNKDIENICSFMEKHCSPAHELLAGSKLPWATKETFRKAWERFYQTQLDFSPSAVPAYCDVLDIYLVYSLIVLRTFVSYKETLTMTTELFDCFTEYINKKNSRSHKATCQDSVTSAEDSKQPDENRSGTGTGQP